MMRHHVLLHRFVTNIPDSVEPGYLYVSMEYATAAHSCCCGCGEEVVTPFTPTDWKMTFDGEAARGLGGHAVVARLDGSTRCVSTQLFEIKPGNAG